MEQVKEHTLQGDKLLSVKTAAMMLDIHRTTLYNEINAGRLPVVKCDGARTVIWQSDLQRWLDERYTGIVTRSRAKATRRENQQIVR